MFVWIKTQVWANIYIYVILCACWCACCVNSMMNIVYVLLSSACLLSPSASSSSSSSMKKKMPYFTKKESFFCHPVSILCQLDGGAPYRLFDVQQFFTVFSGAYILYAVIIFETFFEGILQPTSTKMSDKASSQTIVPLPHFDLVLSMGWTHHWAEPPIGPHYLAAGRSSKGS